MPNWNPWHGCRKKSEGCQNCYMYFLDAQRGRDGAQISRVKAGFDLPVRKHRDGSFLVKPGSRLFVCMTSDFFLEEADPWRPEAWEMIRARPDVLFCITTKRPERAEKCLPSGWGAEGWENVQLNVTAENQRRANERLPVLLSLPFRRKGVFASPLLEEIRMERYLASGSIGSVSAGGENYVGARVCDFAWIESLYAQCREAGVGFDFWDTGALFRKDGRLYRIPYRLRREQARKAGLHLDGAEKPFVPPAYPPESGGQLHLPAGGQGADIPSRSEEFR